MLDGGGVRRWTITFISIQRFLIRFRSGLCAGQSIFTISAFSQAATATFE